MPPQIIRTPFAGAERAAEVLGVTPKRTRELILLAKQAVEQDPELRSLRTRNLNGRKNSIAANEEALMTLSFSGIRRRSGLMKQTIEIAGSVLGNTVS